MRFVSILLALLCALALAEKAGATPRDEDLFIRPIDQRITLFASAEGGSSLFLSGGSKQALIGPLDRPGFLALESTGIGLTRERIRFGDSTLRIDRFTHQGSVLGGYQTMLGPLYLAAYAGPEIEQQQIAYDGQVARFSRPRLGAKTQVEIWWNPTPLVVSSARSSLWARASAGLLVWDKTFVGPELTIYTTPTYRETKIGAHVTGAAIGIVNLRISGGVMTDDGHRSVSPYGSLSAWIRL